MKTMTHAQMIAGALWSAEASEGRPLTPEQRAGLLSLVEEHLIADPRWLPDDLGQGLLAAVRADDGRTGIGFYATSPEGRAMHVNGARAMDEETQQAIGTLADLAYKQVARHAAGTLRSAPGAGRTHKGHREVQEGRGED